MSPVSATFSERTIRFALPTAVDLVFVLVALSLSVGALAPRLLGDAGTGWHIRNGELILQNHAVTRTDPFSASVGGQAWYAWEWLYDVGAAAIHLHWGLNGVVLSSALLIALVFALLLRLAIAQGAGLPVAIVFTALAAGASSIHFLARPHILSWLFSALWFWLLDSAENNTTRLYWLPPIMLLWVNLHGGFVVGFILLGIYLVVSLFNGAARTRNALGLVTALSFAASFVNPYGYQLHLHVYRYLTDRFLMDHIDEFRSPNFHGVPQQCFAALLIAGMLAAGIRKEEIPLARILVLLFAAYSGLLASRSLPVSSILIALIAAPILSRSLAQNPRWAAFFQRMTRMELQSRGHGWPLLILIVLLWRVGSLHAAFDAKKFPVQIADQIARQGTTAPIFCPDDWGGYLIYRLYPQSKVFVDDRHDLYGDEFLKKYLNTIRVAPGWNELLDERRVQWVLVPVDSSLANMLAATGHWTTRAKDPTAVLYQRNQP
jgi:hypothetical protein